MATTPELIALASAVAGAAAGIFGAATSFLMKLQEGRRAERKDKIELDQKVAEAVAAQLDGYREREEELRKLLADHDSRIRELEAERSRLVDEHFKREQALWETIRGLTAEKERLRAELDQAVLEIGAKPKG